MMRTALPKLAAFLSVASLLTIGATQPQREGSLALSPVQRAASRALDQVVDANFVRRGPSLFADPSDRHYDAPLRATDPATMPTTPGEQLRTSACRADAVVVGTLSAPSGFLAENARFILTEYSLTVRETLKGSLTPGDVVAYIRPGGKLMINGRTVEVTASAYPELSEAAPYLLFLRRVSNDDASFTVFVGRDDEWIVNAVLLDDNRASGIDPSSIRELRRGIDARDARASARCSR